MSRAAARIADRLTDVFWVGGLLALHLWGVTLWDRADPELREWTLYLALGSSFPAAVVALTALGPTHALGRPLRQFCAAALALMSIPLLIANFDWTLVCAIAAHAVLLVAALASGLPDRTPAAMLRALGPESLADALAAGFAIALSWTLARSLIHWRDLGEMIVAEPYSLAVFGAALVCASLALFPLGVPAARHRWAARAGRVFAVLVIAAFAFNLGPVMATDDSFEHWAWAAGPAQLVREGGWLLWDVHSTYGALSTLAIAALPFESTWQSLYWLNASLLAITGWFVFGAFARLGRGVAGFLAALLVAVCATFLLPGHADRLSGVQLYPSVGAFRFVWCYLLLGVVLWDCRNRERPDRLARSAWTGNAVWLLGALWSFESAAYCSAIWLPAYGLILWDALGDAAAPGARRATFVRRAAPWLAIPLVLATLALTSICAGFALRLGELPDFAMYVEAARAFGSDFNVRAVDLDGNVWSLILVFSIASTLAARALQPGEAWASRAIVGVAAFFAVWATASSYVPHSTLAQVLNLAPIDCAALAILARIGPPPQSRLDGGVVMRACLVPLLTIVIFAALGDRAGVGSFLEQARTATVSGDPIDERVPLEDPELLRLLERAGVAAGDPITSLQRDLLGRIRFRGPGGASVVRAEHPALLPIKPAWALTALGGREHRTRLFVERWIARHRPAGWLLVPRRDPHLLWLLESLAASHVTTARYSNAEWTLLRLQPRQ